MGHDKFDDGLVHRHGWSFAAAYVRRDERPQANPHAARLPSTVTHDDAIFTDPTFGE
jgi:hypothetical protein